jgi:hypothetical protein
MWSRLSYTDLRVVRYESEEYKAEDQDKLLPDSESTAAATRLSFTGGHAAAAKGWTAE